jgi:hypothetical protein
MPKFVHRLHTIPVPEGWSVEQAWEAIVRGDRFTLGRGTWWANIVVEDDTRFVTWIR